MKKTTALACILIIMIAGAQVKGKQTVFKQKKYYGPIPNNSISMNIGFLDGASATNLTDYLTYWARTERNGEETWQQISASPYVRVGYTGRISSDIHIRTSICFSYLRAKSIGNLVAHLDTLTPLETKREFRTYLISTEIGFKYTFITPKPKSYSPYCGAGFSAVFPFEKLKTNSWNKGTPLYLPQQNKSESSMEVGMHSEIGLEYFITNRFSSTIELRYQMEQSKFDFRNANFDIDYSSFTLSIGVYHYF